MMRGSLLCTILMFAGPVVAAPASTQPDEVAVLVAQLGSDDWQEREAAQERLVRIGSEARESLQRALRESENAEIRSRAEVALAQITENAEVGPSIITIRGTNLRITDVAERLSEQAGVKFDVFPPPDVTDAMGRVRPQPTFSLDIDRQNFWDAMKVISQTTGYTFQNWEGHGPRLVQGGGGNDEGIGVTSGAFLISATRIMHTRAIDYTPAGNPQRPNVAEDFYIQLTARAEPKLRLLRVEYVPQVEQVEDEHGNSLLPEGLPENAGFAVAPGGMWQMSVRLRPLPDMGQRIAILKGSVNVALQTQSERIEIPDITRARSVTRSAGGVRFLVRELRKEGENWVVEITATPEAPAAAAAGADWDRLQQIMSMSDLRLLDERGESFARTGFASSNGDGQETRITIEFSSRAWARNHRLGEPTKLVWTVATATKEIDVPFEFRDLPIP